MRQGGVARHGHSSDRMSGTLAAFQIKISLLESPRMRNLATRQQMQWPEQLSLTAEGSQTFGLNCNHGILHTPSQPDE